MSLCCLFAYSALEAAEPLERITIEARQWGGSRDNDEVCSNEYHPRPAQPSFVRSILLLQADLTWCNFLKSAGQWLLLVLADWTPLGGSRADPFPPPWWASERTQARILPFSSAARRQLSTQRTHQCARHRRMLCHLGRV